MSSVALLILKVKTNKFELAAKTKIPRLVHSAVLLNDGRVLIVGGGAGKVKLTNTEIYDPKTNKFELIGNMNIAKVLPNVYVLRMEGGSADK